MSCATTANLNRRRHDDEGYGLSAREEEIVALLEAGVSPGEVAQRFGKRTGAIVTMQRRYIITVDQLTRFERACRAGDAKYRAALAATVRRYA